MRESKRADALIILIALTVSLCLYLSGYGRTGTKIAKVYQDGKLTDVIEFDEETDRYEIKINGSVLVVENGEVYYTNSDCPDKLCEKFGHLSSNGDTASCVPNKTVVTIETSENPDGEDIMTY